MDAQLIVDGRVVALDEMHVAAEHGETIQALHASVNTEMTAKGRQPESYRRWLLKLKRRWVRAVVANGARVDDLETLASTM